MDTAYETQRQFTSSYANNTACVHLPHGGNSCIFINFKLKSYSTWTKWTYRNPAIFCQRVNTFLCLLCCTHAKQHSHPQHKHKYIAIVESYTRTHTRWMAAVTARRRHPFANRRCRWMSTKITHNTNCWTKLQCVCLCVCGGMGFGKPGAKRKLARRRRRKHSLLSCYRDIVNRYYTWTHILSLSFSLAFSNSLLLSLSLLLASRLNMSKVILTRPLFSSLSNQPNKNLHWLNLSALHIHLRAAPTHLSTNGKSIIIINKSKQNPLDMMWFICCRWRWQSEFPYAMFVFRSTPEKIRLLNSCGWFWETCDDVGGVPESISECLAANTSNAGQLWNHLGQGF